MSTQQAAASSTRLPVPELAKDFPASTASPSHVFPFPGVTDGTTQTVRRILTANDHTSDIYEKLRFAHNHFPHSALTRYALGATSPLLEANWKHDEKHMVSLDPATGDHKVNLSRVPDTIDRDNWDDPKYLAYDGCYSRYLAFFHKEIDRLGPVGTLREYVFSPTANWGGRDGKPPAQMLARTNAGALHPLIHIGFGLEFKDRIVLAEGLAEACVHSIERTSLALPPDLVKRLCTELPKGETVPSLSVNDPWTDQAPQNPRTTKRTVLEIYAEFQDDPAFKPVAYDPDMSINDRIKHAVEGDKGKKLAALVSSWGLNEAALGEGRGGVEDRLKEIGLLATLTACASGRRGKEKRVDFFLMHNLTSSIFTQSYLSVLDLHHRRAFLEAYLGTLLVTCAARGRPRLDVGLLMSFPIPTGDLSRARPGQVIANPLAEGMGDRWSRVVENSLFAQDSHVPKSIRSLIHYSMLYGGTSKGGFLDAVDADSGETLEGLKEADGTIFLRGAGLIMDVMGWVLEGEKEGSWDRSALGYDEAWK